MAPLDLGVSALGRSFDQVADVYDEVRPDYPDEVYAAIEGVAGSLAGACVLDLACGPGTATRQLQSRGARVVAVDPGMPLLRRLRARSAQVPVVAAVAERLPFKEGAFDVICCATAFHWLDAPRAVGELRRVLRPAGVVAVWWANHRRDDRIAWEAAQARVHERWQLRGGSRPPTSAGVDPRSTAAYLRSCGLDVVVDTELTWSRVVSREQHLQVLGTHSDVLALGPDRTRLLGEIDAALQQWSHVEERLWGPLVVARMP